MRDNRLWYVLGFVAVVGCGILLALGIGLAFWLRGGEVVAAPPSELFATLEAATPTIASAVPPAVPSPVSSEGPTGKISFTCQLFRVQASNQICLINADGTGWRRLTTDGGRQHVYSSVTLDGRSVVYSAFRKDNTYEIYELDLTSGVVEQLTDSQGVLNAAEVSPDGRLIVYTRGTPPSPGHALWIMNRDGSDPHAFFAPPGADAWDPTWSPDGTEVLFASDMGGSAQLWTVSVEGGEPRQVSHLPALRGRSDWSVLNEIITYSGEPWGRELFLMSADGSNQRKISPPGGNSQGPSFSPDGKWVAFTAYFDRFKDDHGCEIYIMRTDGTDLRRLTNNDYCDYQPRWGP